LPKFGHWRSIAGGYRRDPNGVAHDGPAIHSDGGVVQVDPRAILSTFSGNAPLTTGTSTFVTRTIPAITANEGNPRSGADDLIARIHGPAGARGFVFLSKPHAPTTVPGLGQLWVDPRNLIFFGSGTVSAGSSVEVREPLPLGIRSLGETFALQALLLDQGGFELTTPVHPILVTLGDVGYGSTAP